MKWSQYLLIPLVSSFSFAAQASDYGTTGIIDTPTARMGKDGLLSLSVSRDQYWESYALTYQALPWLETTFRYAGLNNDQHWDKFEIKSDDYWDRNYAIKIRLLEESQYQPAVALGIRDLVGSGLLGSEYIVANKRWHGLDVSLGLGWGRLADAEHMTNPLRHVSEDFLERPLSVGIEDTGKFRPEVFFSGEQVGVFGGITYQLESFPLTFALEYNGDEYRWETLGGLAKPSSPLSYGLTWHVDQNIDVRLSHQHLDTVGLGIQLKLDTQAPPGRFIPEPYQSATTLSASAFPSGLNPDSWYDKFLFDMERSSLFVLSADLDITGGLATIEIANETFPNWQDALSHAHYLADLHLPAYIHQIHFVINEQGHSLQTIALPRQYDFNQPSGSLKLDLAQFTTPKLVPTPLHSTNFVKDTWFIDVGLGQRFMLFDPENPLSYQVFLKLFTKINLPDNWSIRSMYRVDLNNNFSELDRVSNSVLPHVRSDALRYLQNGESGLANLFVEKRDTLTHFPNLHYRVYGGILEEMYSGVGTELLYQPHDSRLAFGMSASWAKQRDYDAGFGHLDYQTLTGHASVYWATPFYGYDVALHAGRYLAKDVGATLELRRTFANGWQVGMWATKTDVSSEEFGEGSFDKGLFFRIPFDSVINKHRKSISTTRIRPVQRDGGARLEGYSGQLWWDVRDASPSVFTQGR